VRIRRKSRQPISAVNQFFDLQFHQVF
jgi:hypothetical protein